MRRPEDIACQALIEQVTDYLDDRIPAAERAEIDAHLALCDGCAHWFAQMRETRARLGDLRVSDLPAAQRDAIRAVFRGWRGGSTP
ncbi:MAG: zf-HC2 domain-containing protein [Polyangiales bacterium]